MIQFSVGWKSTALTRSVRLNSSFFISVRLLCRNSVRENRHFWEDWGRTYHCAEKSESWSSNLSHAFRCRACSNLVCLHFRPIMTCWDSRGKQNTHVKRRGSYCHDRVKGWFQALPDPKLLTKRESLFQFHMWFPPGNLTFFGCLSMPRTFPRGCATDNSLYWAVRLLPTATKVTSKAELGSMETPSSMYISPLAPTVEFNSSFDLWIPRWFFARGSRSAIHGRRWDPHHLCAESGI